MIDHDIQLEVLHGRIKVFLDGGLQAVNLVDEEYATALDVREQTCEVAGFIDHRTACRSHLGSHGIANNAQYAAWGWRELPVPVIAAVHGVAFGAGSQIMAAADIRIVHPDNPSELVNYGDYGRVELTTLTREFFMPRFLERDETIRRAPRPPYAWDGVGDVRPFGAMEKTIVEGVY